MKAQTLHINLILGLSGSMLVIVKAQTLLTNLILSWKGLPGTNNLGYLANSLEPKKKSFITLTTG